MEIGNLFDISTHIYNNYGEKAIDNEVVKMIFWDFMPASDIQDVVALQTKLLEKKQAGDTHQYILAAEHMPCISYFLARNLNDYRVGPKERAAYRNTGGAMPQIPVVQTKRGGGITYHGPGQLTFYTVMSHKEIGIDAPKQFREILFRALRRILQTYGVVSYALREIYEEGLYVSAIAHQLSRIGIKTKRDLTNTGALGLWVIDAHFMIKKIVSYGVRWEQRKHAAHTNNGCADKIVTFGFALNIATDLTIFNEVIKPCGLPIQMTSMQEQTHRDAFDMESIAKCIVKEIGTLTRQNVKKIPPEGEDLFYA